MSVFALAFEPNQFVHAYADAFVCFCAVFLRESCGFSSDSPIPDCTPLVDFLEDELMALTHTASFGSSCVTIETLVHFGEDGLAEELAPDGTVIGSFSYTVMEVDGQCALASTVSDCEVQLLSFNEDESAMIMSLNGAGGHIDPVALSVCAGVGRGQRGFGSLILDHWGRCLGC